jgi:hypothetical protein
MCAMTSSPSHTAGSRALTAVSTLLLAAVAACAVIVGVYAVRNPNHIEFGGGWTKLSEIVAAGAAIVLGLGVRTQRRRRNAPLFVAGLAAALVSLALLGLVAFVLSFNQL